MSTTDTCPRCVEGEGGLHEPFGIGRLALPLLNQRSKTNLCLDVGFGREGSTAVYFAVQEAF